MNSIVHTMPLAAPLDEMFGVEPCPLLFVTVDAAARQLDRLLDDQQRTLTALELLGDAKPSHLAAAQLATTARMLERLDPRAPLPSRHAAEGWPIWSLGAGLVFVALALLMLKGVMQPFSPLQAGTLPPELDTNAALASPTPASGLPDSERTPDATQTSQGPLLQWLRQRGLEHRSFYIVNSILVKGTRQVVEALAARPDVAPSRWDTTAFDTKTARRPRKRARNERSTSSR